MATDGEPAASPPPLPAVPTTAAERAAAKEARRVANREAHRAATEAGASAGSSDGSGSDLAGPLPPSVLATAHGRAREGKGVLAEVRRRVKATVLAVLAEGSGASTSNRLEAARLGATIGGLSKPPPVVVNVGFAVAFGAMGGRVAGEEEGGAAD